MENITYFSPIRIRKFRILNHGFVISKNALTTAPNPGQIIADKAIEAVRVMVQKAASEGFIEITTDDLIEGQRYSVRAAFLTPKDLHELKSDILSLEGGHEIIKKYWNDDITN